MKDPYRSSVWNRIAKFLRAIYPHLIFILSAMFITFWILEKYNPVMGFLTGSISIVLMLVFFILCFIGSVVTIVHRALKKKEDK